MLSNDMMKLKKNGVDNQCEFSFFYVKDIVNKMILILL